ncbi:MAG TPA: hypothetical protein VK196_06915 [Magnetospirillum sp.]|nr:hypothetical protein [Magnetospirillum sp.]
MATGGALRFVEDGVDYTPTAKAPAELDPGEFVLAPFARDGMNENVSVFFRLRHGLNPNLERRHYQVVGADGAVQATKGPRVSVPAARPDAVEVAADPVVGDFARCFWRDRHDQLWPIGEPGRTAIALGIANCGTESLTQSLLGSGWPMVDVGLQPDFIHRAMLGLSVAANDIANPEYPQLIRLHHWSQMGAVIPGAAYFTLLRQPVQRFISLYSTLRALGRTDDSLDDFVAKACELGYPDIQVNWLGQMAGPVQASLLPWGRLPEYIERTPQGMRITPLLMSYAEAALDRFFFIGFLDCFDESLWLAHLLMRSPRVGRWRTRNSRRKAGDGELQAMTRRRLETCLAPEIELYDRLRARFHDTYADELRFIRAHCERLETP